MKRNLKLYLQDIWESIIAIEEYSKDISEDRFYSNQQVQDAIIRRLEIIGEAVKNLDDTFRKAHPNIPWKKIVGMRDIIAHEYFGVRIDRVWDVIKQDLPILKREMTIILKKENENTKQNQKDTI